MTSTAEGCLSCLPGGARIIFLSKQGYRLPLISVLAVSKVSSYYDDQGRVDQVSQGHCRPQNPTANSSCVPPHTLVYFRLFLSKENLPLSPAHISFSGLTVH